MNLALEEFKSSTRLHSLNEEYLVLFTSEWDPNCQKLLELVRDRYDSSEGKKLFIVSSWETPEAFSRYKVFQAPTLISYRKTKRGKVIEIREDYLPNIYKALNV